MQAQALQPTLASVKRKLASSANINLEALLSEQLEAIFSRTELPPGATQETENGEQHSLQEPCASRCSLRSFAPTLVSSGFTSPCGIDSRVQSICVIAVAQILYPLQK